MSRRGGFKIDIHPPNGAPRSRGLGYEPNPGWGQRLPTIVRFMAYEYRVTWVKDEKLQSTLTEWTNAGYELVTATTCESGMGKYGVFWHYLYFRR
jgi:hypothetical protein